jgi:hypothetical protein
LSNQHAGTYVFMSNIFADSMIEHELYWRPFREKVEAWNDSVWEYLMPNLLHRQHCEIFDIMQSAALVTCEWNRQHQYAKYLFDELGDCKENPREEKRDQQINSADNSIEDNYGADVQASNRVPSHRELFRNLRARREKPRSRK